INPIVINQHPDIQFWISVSGVDDKENFLYLYEENLKIHGVPDDTVAILSHELEQGYRISHAGKSFSTYLAATKNLRRDPWLDRFNNGRKTTEADYAAYQKGFRKEAFDSVSGLQIYVEDFAALLSNIHCPVLALFGEKDKNVDWRKTKKLYERTMGEKTNLQIQSFPDGNHNLFKCKTGGFYEFEDDGLPYHRCDGFLDVITNWLNALE
ncbi:MAG: alpha/beta hydrolase, partial [Bacteroidota bacterium]